MRLPLLIRTGHSSGSTEFHEPFSEVIRASHDSSGVTNRRNRSSSSRVQEIGKGLLDSSFSYVSVGQEWQESLSLIMSPESPVAARAEPATTDTRRVVIGIACTRPPNVRDQRRRAVGAPLALPTMCAAPPSPASGVTTEADRCIA